MSEYPMFTIAEAAGPGVKVIAVYRRRLSQIQIPHYLNIPCTIFKLIQTY